jgi:hypothetical protein
METSEKQLLQKIYAARHNDGSRLPVRRRREGKPAGRNERLAKLCDLELLNGVLGVLFELKMRHPDSSVLCERGEAAIALVVNRIDNDQDAHVRHDECSDEEGLSETEHVERNILREVREK